MPMPAHLQAAKERSQAKEAAKVEPGPRVTLLGLRKAAGGFEVVSFSAAATDVTVVQTAEPLQFSARSLLRAIQTLVDQA